MWGSTVQQSALKQGPQQEIKRNIVEAKTRAFCYY